MNFSFSSEMLINSQSNLSSFSELFCCSLLWPRWSQGDVQHALLFTKSLITQLAWVHYHLTSVTTQAQPANPSKPWEFPPQQYNCYPVLLINFVLGLFLSGRKNVYLTLHFSYFLSWAISWTLLCDDSIPHSKPNLCFSSGEITFTWGHTDQNWMWSPGTQMTSQGQVLHWDALNYLPDVSTIFWFPAAMNRRLASGIYSRPRQHWGQPVGVLTLKYNWLDKTVLLIFDCFL